MTDSPKPPGGMDFDPNTVQGMFEQYYLDYSSYVILDRAVPDMEDGLKPVQRRILHALQEMDDGRYNKVANVIGHAMRYHPHGDTSIGDALVNLGQKDLLIDTQGNWGNVFTGDGAAAARYIEARLSAFARKVVFNPKLTEWQASYDGRSREPVKLPVKFPLLLAQGAEGIAVGLSTKILPHNFCELIEACIASLREEPFEIFPDFPSGGLIDVSDYQQGKRGGRVKVRARIEAQSSRILEISDLPYGVTTTGLIESVINANDKGKIKIKKVEDNTAKNVEILIHLPSGGDPQTTIDALYAFTQCEISIAPNCCIIRDNRPEFLTVQDLVSKAATQTKALLGRELEIKAHELSEKIFFGSLEQIFIEKKIYRHIEECETWEAVLSTIEQKLKPHIKGFYRQLTQDDIIKLTEIKIKRISKYDKDKANQQLEALRAELEETQKHLSQLKRFSINYFKGLLKEFGKDKQRRTKITRFTSVDKQAVAAANCRLYMNAKEGFIGTSLRREEFLFECSDMDEIICFTKDGHCRVVKVASKVFIGKNIIYVQLYKRGDKDTIYNMIYRDKKSATNMVKRFTVPSVTRDKEYNITKGEARLLYFSVHDASEEAEWVRVSHKPAPRLQKIEFDLDFNEVNITSRDAKGIILSKHTIAKVEPLEDEDE